MATIIHPLATNSSPTPPPDAGSKGSVLPGASEETFLQLLVTQLKNQDPTNPMDGTQFVAQLAQFSELEQMINVNTNLQQLHQDLTNSGQAASGTPAQP